MSIWHLPLVIVAMKIKIYLILSYLFKLVCFLNWLFAAKFSNCSDSLNFEAKSNCNTIKSNVLKGRKICIGLKFNLVHFDGPQTKFEKLDHFEGPCTFVSIEKYPQHTRTGSKCLSYLVLK